MDNFITILDRFECTIEEKKSEFIANITPVKSEEEAQGFIEEIKKIEKGARHNVYAYIIGKNEEIQRYSDDKEPKGTAGLPVLDQLKKANLKNVCIVVTRYFGGTLLGASLLTRTYASAANEVIKKAEKVTIVTAKEFSVEIPYDFYTKQTLFLNEGNFEIYDTSFNDKVLLKLRSKEDETILIDEFTNRTSNKAVISKFKTGLFFEKDDGSLIEYKE